MFARLSLDPDVASNVNGLVIPENTVGDRMKYAQSAENYFTLSMKIPLTAETVEDPTALLPSNAHLTGLNRKV